MAYLRFHPDLLDVGGVDCWVPRIGYSSALVRTFCLARAAPLARTAPAPPQRRVTSVIATEALPRRGAAVFAGAKGRHAGQRLPKPDQR
jgi:hypothetical protein